MTSPVGASAKKFVWRSAAVSTFEYWLASEGKSEGRAFSSCPMRRIWAASKALPFGTKSPSPAA